METLFEDQYMDVLYNIETSILSVYRDNPDLSDYSVISSLEALIDNYKGEEIGRPPRKFNLSDVELNILDNVHQACEWHLGRIPVISALDNKEMFIATPITVEEIILCLKRIIKSAKLWNKEGGRQGYLEFIDEHVM